jgi:hypothetical protein
MIGGLTNQCNLLSSLGSVLNALSLPRTAFFRWVSEVIGLCAGLAGVVVAEIGVLFTATPDFILDDDFSSACLKFT